MAISLGNTTPETTKAGALVRNEALQILIGVGLLFGASQISIPLQPVPITLQTVAVMLIGLFYSRKTAIKTVLSYLALGAVGAPVFSNFSGGLPVLLGTRGGYLIGFLLAVAAMTIARERILKETYISMICNCFVGHTIIFAAGIAWLSFLIGFNQAIQFGLLPFIIPGILKSVLLGACVRSLKS